MKVQGFVVEGLGLRILGLRVQSFYLNSKPQILNPKPCPETSKGGHRTPRGCFSIVSQYIYIYISDGRRATGFHTRPPLLKFPTTDRSMTPNENS